MPIACTNCLKFHFGTCREPPKTCYTCGGSNRIERFCPTERTFIQPEPGEPLAGTPQWCKKHGLNDDPDLKFKILTALKSSPGSPIWLAGVRIYGGSEKHFEFLDGSEPSRGRRFDDFDGDRYVPEIRMGMGRPIAERVTYPRNRSMSPDRQRFPERRASTARYRERSPLREWGPPVWRDYEYGSYENRGPDENQHPRYDRPYDHPPFDYRPYDHHPRYDRDYPPYPPPMRYRSRTPPRRRSPSPHRHPRPWSRTPPRRRSPSPYRQPVPPSSERKYRASASAAEVHANMQENHQPLVKFHIRSVAPSLASRITYANNIPNPDRNPLEPVINNTPNTKQPRSQHTEIQEPHSPATVISISPGHTPIKKPKEQEIENPHSILCITKNATHNEIIEAYAQRVREVKEEQNREGILDSQIPGTIWEETYRLLRAARRQMLRG